MTSHNVIVYERAGADPAVDRIVTDHAGRRTTLVAADGSAIVRAATEAVGEGADQIELCGGFGPVWHARVIEAVGDDVPVGAVMYGFESLTGVADYKARFGQEPMREAFVYVQPGSDPAVDRTVVENVEEQVKLFHVAVPDVKVAPGVAVELVETDGVQLLELYGGFEPGDAARVLEALDARIPVGVPSYGYAGARRPAR
jgi:hypothetical protein